METTEKYFHIEEVIYYNNGAEYTNIYYNIKYEDIKMSCISKIECGGISKITLQLMALDLNSTRSAGYNIYEPFTIIETLTPNN